MKTVIIVDDEQDAIDLLQEYISEYQDFDIIGTSTNGHDAVRLINTLKPHLVFLDIQMPGLTGFEVLTQLDEVPEIIFSTAYDQFALNAFEVHAVDYLLKPYGKQRVANALQKIIQTQESILKMAERLLEEKNLWPEKVILQKGMRKVFVSTSDILYAEAFGDYTKVFTLDNEYLANTGITSLLEKLNPQFFIRIHRSHFVAINSITEIRKNGRYSYAVLAKFKELRISESHVQALKKLML